MDDEARAAAEGAGRARVGAAEGKKREPAAVVGWHAPPPGRPRSAPEEGCEAHESWREIGARLTTTWLACSGKGGRGGGAGAGAA